MKIMTMQRTLVLAVFVTASAGCAAGGGLGVNNGPSNTRVQATDLSRNTLYEFRITRDDRVIAAQAAVPRDQLWTALPAQYQRLGLPITSLDARRYIIRSEAGARSGRIGSVRASKYLDCGRTSSRTEAADVYSVTLFVSNQVNAGASGASQLLTLVQGRAVDPTSNNPAMPCTSTGVLEREIVTALGAQPQA